MRPVDSSAGPCFFTSASSSSSLPGFGRYTTCVFTAAISSPLRSWRSGRVYMIFSASANRLSAIMTNAMATLETETPDPDHPALDRYDTRDLVGVLIEDQAR